MLNYLFATMGPGSSPDPNIYYRTKIMQSSPASKDAGVFVGKNPKEILNFLILHPGAESDILTVLEQIVQFKGECYGSSGLPGCPAHLYPDH